MFLSSDFLDFTEYPRNHKYKVFWCVTNLCLICLPARSVPCCTPAAADRGASASTTWLSTVALSWLTSTATVRQTQSSTSSPNMVRTAHRAQQGGGGGERTVEFYTLSILLWKSQQGVTGEIHENLFFYKSQVRASPVEQVSTRRTLWLFFIDMKPCKYESGHC